MWLVNLLWSAALWIWKSGVVTRLLDSLITSLPTILELLLKKRDENETAKEYVERKQNEIVERYELYEKKDGPKLSRMDKALCLSVAELLRRKRLRENIQPTGAGDGVLPEGSGVRPGGDSPGRDVPVRPTEGSDS